MVAQSTILSPNKYAGNEGRIFIGIHTSEAPETATTAESVAKYFQRSSTEASAHWCVDDNSRVRCVEDGDSAWTMPPCNHISLNVEIAGYANQSKAQWSDAYSKAALNIAALCVAEWCHKYNIPVRHLTLAQIRDHQKGIVGHVDVDNVYHESTHWDPGPNFPWTSFLTTVNLHLATIKGEKPPAPAPTPTPQPPSELGSAKPSCVQLQRAVHITADNSWGPNTDKACNAVHGATSDRFPYGVKYAQARVGASQDGSWGPASKADLTETIKRIQSALHDMGFKPGAFDGTWGSQTNAAYLAARKACHV